MSTELKYPKKGAVGRLRQLYFEITKKPLTPDQRKNLEDAFEKKDHNEEADKSRPKKIAKPEQDAGLV